MVANRRDDLHRLIDEIPERDVPTVRRMLRALCPSPMRKFLDAAPLDDEELTPGDLQAIDEARADVAAGRVVNTDELRRRLAERDAQP